MVVFATALLALSLSGIGLLFAHKYRELKAGSAVVPETLREAGDVHALALKELLGSLRSEARGWPPRVAHIARVYLHRTLIWFASLARTLERSAYRLADRLSHRHQFEPRERSNDFLKQVSDFKNTDSLE